MGRSLTKPAAQVPGPGKGVAPHQRVVRQAGRLPDYVREEAARAARGVRAEDSLLFTTEIYLEGTSPTENVCHGGCGKKPWDRGMYIE